MSQPPPPQCNKQFTALTNSWSLVDGRMQPLRSEVSPTLSPAKAQELVKKQIEYKEKKDTGRRATDMSTPWTMPAQYAPSPLNVTLARMSEEYDLMRSWSSVFLIVRCLPPLKGTRGPVGSLRLSCARHGFEMRHPKVSFVCEKVEGQRDSLCRCSVGENTASHWGGVF